MYIKFIFTQVKNKKKEYNDVLGHVTCKCDIYEELEINFGCAMCSL